MAWASTEAGFFFFFSLLIDSIINSILQHQWALQHRIASASAFSFFYSSGLPFLYFLHWVLRPLDGILVLLFYFTVLFWCFVWIWWLGRQIDTLDLAWLRIAIYNLCYYSLARGFLFVCRWGDVVMATWAQGWCIWSSVSCCGQPLATTIGRNGNVTALYT